MALKTNVRIWDFCKDFVNHHRKITAFQKVAVLSIFVGVLLLLFRTLWLFGLVVTYGLSLYCTNVVCKRIRKRENYIPSDLLLIFVEKLEDFRLKCRNFLSPILVDPNGGDHCHKLKTTGVDSQHQHDSPSSFQQCTEALATSSSNEESADTFFDALEDAPQLVQRPSSVFYIELDDCESQEENDLNEVGSTGEKQVTHAPPDHDVEQEIGQTTGPSTEILLKGISTNEPLAVEQETELLLSLIHRDFVKTWFSLISKDDEVLLEASDIFQCVFMEFQNRLEKAVHSKHEVARDIMLLFRQHINRVKQAREQFLVQYRTRRRSSAKPLSNSEPSSPKSLPKLKSVVDFFEAKYDFHPALQDENTQVHYLNAIIDVILYKVLPEELVHSKCVKYALREILTCNVVNNVLNLVSDPTFVHERIIKITSDEEIVGMDDQKKPVQPPGRPADVAPTGLSGTAQNNLMSSSVPTMSVGGDRTLPVVFTLAEEDDSQSSKCNSELTESQDSQSDSAPPSVIECNPNLGAKNLLSVDCHVKESRVPASGMKYSHSDSELDLDKTGLDSCESPPVFEPGPSSINGSVNTERRSDSDTVKSGPKQFFTDHFRQLLRRTSEKTQTSSRNSQSLEPIDEHAVGNESVVKRSFSSSEVQKGHERSGSWTDLEDVPVPTEGPTTFQDAHISGTETAREAGSSALYTLYVIEYEAVYHKEDAGLVIKSGKVKRRFREFVNLQSCLDSNPDYKKSMKDVKGPRRWLSLPFGNMDKDSIESRKTLLENFLKALIQKDDICNCSELKMFLGYSGDGHIAFVRKGPDVGMPRLDQMIVRKMSGVFDKFVDVLPSLPTELPKIIKKDEVKEESSKLLEDTDQLELNFMFQENEAVSLPVCLGFDKVLEMCDEEGPLDASSWESDDSTVLGTSSLEWQDRILSRMPRAEGDGADLPDEEETKQTKRRLSVARRGPAPLADAVLDLLVALLQGRDSWMCREKVITSLKVLLGKALNRYLQTKIDFLTSREMSEFYLWTLRETIWPDGELSLVDRPNYSEKQKQAVREQASRCLGDFLPGVLRLLLGEDDFQFTVEEVMETIKYEKLNRHFWFLVLDILLERLFPEISADDVYDKLVRGSFYKPERHE